MKQNLRLTFDKGLNADALPSELGGGFVTDCSNVRFRNGSAEAIGGGELVADLVSTQLGSLSALHLSSATYVVGAGASPRSVYAWEFGTSNVSNITRYSEGGSIASMTAAGTTVTVTTNAAHGRTTGNTISLWGAAPSEYNVEGVSITVTGANTFTYTAASAPSASPATRVGRWSYGTSRSNFSDTLSNAGEFNGILLLNSETDGLYYWNGDTSIPLRRVVGLSRAKFSVAFGNYIVCLSPVISNVSYPYRILWSSAAEPGSLPTEFLASSTNDSGLVDRPDIGEMVTAAPLGNDLIIYGSRGRLLMRYVGGSAVFSFTRLVGDDGCISKIAVTPVGHVFVNSNRQVLIHNGGECKNLSENRVQSLLNTSVGDFVVVAHPRQCEVWIGYKDAVVSLYATDFLVWNWVENTWGFRGVSSAYDGIAAGPDEKRLYFAIGKNLYEYDIEGGETSAYIERKGITAGDADYVKNLQRSRWNFDAVSAMSAYDTYTIEHGSHMVSDASPTYASSVAYLPESTDYCNARATGGRYLAVKASWSTSARPGSETPANHIRVRSADLDFTVGGKR